jgi:hypothetical protein
MTKQTDSLFLKCSCTSHALEIQRFNFSNPDTNYTDEGFNISIWVNSFNYKLCWSERFRWIWNILKTGVPWSDNIILSNEQTKQLNQYIEQHLPRE